MGENLKLRITAAAMAGVLMLTMAACGGRSNAPESKGPETAGSDNGLTVDSRAAADGSDSLPEEAGPDYAGMAARFAVYCEQIYLGFEEWGTVTAGEVSIDEGTDAGCRITVYYNEPALESEGLMSPGGEGYILFSADKTTARGRMEQWVYLGNAEYPTANDMREEAKVRYGFPEDAVFDFKEGVILSGGSVAADVQAYFDS